MLFLKLYVEIKTVKSEFLMSESCTCDANITTIKFKHAIVFTGICFGLLHSRNEIKLKIAKCDIQCTLQRNRRA